MNPIEKRLRKKRVLILDGAFASELERRGLCLADELWSARALLDYPELVRAVHLDYLRAGAEIITTASYQATLEGFCRKGAAREKAAELIRRSVRLAREAAALYQSENPAAAPPLIAASLGPYGACLADGSEYRGGYGLTKEELRLFHRERLRLLAEAHPDIIAFETLPSLLEAEALVEELRTHPQLSCWLSFSCRDGRRISDGTPLALCAARLAAAPQVAALGVNCTAPEFITPLIRQIRQETKKPVIVYPNSGETYDTESGRWHGARLPLAVCAAAWQEAGACIIGGCCRTRPEDIAALAAWAKRLEP